MREVSSVSFLMQYRECNGEVMQLLFTGIFGLRFFRCLCLRVGSVSLAAYGFLALIFFRRPDFFRDRWPDPAAAAATALLCCLLLPHVKQTNAMSKNL